MRKFTKLTAIVAPIKISNVDTDRIIPAQYLKLIHKSGFGKYLFAQMRYNGDGTENESFILNNFKYRNAEFLVTQENFGCGSSREHAAWAIADYGIKAIIAPSFADIFYNNSFKNGLLLVKLKQQEVDEIMRVADENKKITVDLEKEIVVADGKTYAFSNVDAFKKNCLLKGLDDISLTLQKKDLIDKFEAKQKKDSPWLWNG